MRHTGLILLLMVILSFVQAQEKVTLNGYIKDSLSGETLIGANLLVKAELKGVTSNQYGFYSITLKKGVYKIVFSFVGYLPKEISIDLHQPQQQNILLVPLSSLMNDVTVYTRKRDNNVKTAQMGKFDLPVSTAKALPSFLGEVDILKTLQLLPGVMSAGEGNAGFYVRGGGPDQNLIMLDDAVVYNTGHLFGFFSIFNADAVKNVSLIKGGMPAQYGGRLSSVVDVTMKEGNENKTQIDAGIGLIASRFSIQGPIIKKKMSFMVSGRRTYIDVLSKPFIPKSSGYAGTGYYFYDLNAKINYQFSDKDRLYLSGYFGRDKFNFNDAQRAFNTLISWGNATSTLRWNHIFSKKLFANTTLVYNAYDFKLDAGQSNLDFLLSSGIKDLNAKFDVDYYPVPEHRIKFGMQYTYHTFYPSEISGKQDSVQFNPPNPFVKYAREGAIYVQDDWEIGKRIKINYGIRASGFEQVGRYVDYVTDANGIRIDSTVYGAGQKVKTYGGLEPRFTLRYTLNDNASLKFGITRNLQYIHLVSNSNTTLPTDLWVPSTLKVKPEVCWQYAGGYFRNFANGMFETSVEVYYKTMENQIAYESGYTPNSLQDVENSFVFGKGWSYGSEFFINKVKGRLTGWIGYTLSWSWRQFNDLNSGTKFAGNYDRRNDLSVTSTYELSKKWKLSAVFIYASGNPTTLPDKFYFIGGVLSQDYSNINAYRLPAYHRLDLAGTYTPEHKKPRKYKDSWVFALYNAYDHLNPYFIYFSQTGSVSNGNLKVQAKQVTIFPVLPSVTWNVRL